MRRPCLEGSVPLTAHRPLILTFVSSASNAQTLTQKHAAQAEFSQPRRTCATEQRVLRGSAQLLSVSPLFSGSLPSSSRPCCVHATRVQAWGERAALLNQGNWACRHLRDKVHLPQVCICGARAACTGSVGLCFPTSLPQT